MGVRSILKKTKNSRKYLSSVIKKKSPIKPGVYTFLDYKANPIYIGKTYTSIRDRLLQHIDPSHARGKLSQDILNNIKGFDYFICYNKKTCRDIELKLIHKYNPKFNKLSTKSSNSHKLNKK